MLRTGAYLPMLNGIIVVEIIVASGLICLMHFATADNAIITSSYMCQVIEECHVGED